MLPLSTRFLLLWAYVVMVCLPVSTLAQTVSQKSTDYCSVTYTNGCTDNNGLSSVTINGVPLSQNSGCSVGGYGQFTAITTSVSAGQPTSFSIVLLDPNRPHGITIWADLNRNYSIDLGEDLYLSNGPLTGPISGTFAIPAGTASGPLRMRVLSAYNTMPFYPCSTNNGSPVIYEAGETEDYTIYVQGPITGLTTTNITGNTAQVNWNSLGPDVTYVVQWRQQGISYWNNSFAYGAQIILSLIGYTAYEWQVRQSSTMDYTGPVSFTTLCPQPSYLTVNTLSTSANLSWSGTSNPGRTFRLQHRPVGNPTWQTVDSFTTTTYSLTGLTPNTPYEWQVQSVCSSTESTSYTTGPVFTPLCPIPYQPSGNPTATGASFSWQINPAETINSFNLQYRQIGAADWTTINSMTPTSSSYYRSYSLTGLSRNTGYEWRLQTNCALGTQSDYTAIRSFTTVCAPAHVAFTVELSASSTQLVWFVNADADTRFEIRWRPTGTPDWTTVSNLTSTQGQGGNYLLTGLTTNTLYEWQVRTVCSPSESSSFAIGDGFRPRCPAPFVYSWQSGIPKVTSARITWEQAYFVAQYEVYYRPVGSENWLTVSNITTTSAVLTNLESVTPYEWKVRRLCGSGVVSEFSEVHSFTTLSCIIPSGSMPMFASDNSAMLQWYHNGADADTRFEIRWRATGAPDWTTVSNLTVNAGNGLYSLTGLTSNTAYEWQIRARCSPTLLTDFSASINFQTLPPCNSVLYTLRHGSWLDPGTWSCKRVPLPTDVVQIRHNVIFYSNEVGNALRVQFEPGGRVFYSANSRLRLGL